MGLLPFYLSTDTHSPCPQKFQRDSKEEKCGIWMQSLRETPVITIKVERKNLSWLKGKKFLVLQVIKLEGKLIT